MVILACSFGSFWSYFMSEYLLPPQAQAQDQVIHKHHSQTGNFPISYHRETTSTLATSSTRGRAWVRCTHVRNDALAWPARNQMLHPPIYRPPLPRLRWHALRPRSHRRKLARCTQSPCSTDYRSIPLRLPEPLPYC